MDFYNVFDVTFVGDWLYGITRDEDLFAFHLAEDADGKPTVTEERRFIKNPLPEGEQDNWSWIDSGDDDNKVVTTRTTVTIAAVTTTVMMKVCQAVVMMMMRRRRRTPQVVKTRRRTSQRKMA